jgi:hypothetical protein
MQHWSVERTCGLSDSASGVVMCCDTQLFNVLVKSGAEQVWPQMEVYIPPAFGEGIHSGNRTLVYVRRYSALKLNQ